MALALLVYGETNDPLATTALFIAAQFLPAFLAPVMTANVDQRSLRTVLPAIYAAEAALFACWRSWRPRSRCRSSWSSRSSTAS